MSQADSLLCGSSPRVRETSVKPVMELQKLLHGQQENKAAMIAEMDSQGITNENEGAMLMAQVDDESVGFTYTKELGEDSYFDKYKLTLSSAIFSA